jgi:intracellular multiplication protein IcmE
VRDASGRVIGKVSPDGTVVDLSGKPIGKVGTLTNQTSNNQINPQSALAVTPLGIQTPENAADARIKAAMQRQNAAISEQQRAQTQQQMQGAMTAQANQLFAAWASPTQAYVEGMPDKDDTKAGGGDGQATGAKGSGSTASGAIGSKHVLVKGGAIIFAVLDTAVNTDEPGPVMATIVEGNLKGTRLLGKVDRQQKKAMLSFTMMTGDLFPSKVSINAIAIDPDTARTALSSDTDSHYFLRYGTLFASALMQGYATALTTSGSTTVLSPLGGATTVTPVLNPKQKLMVALGTVGTRYQSVLADNFNTPPTVRINAGIGLGILFLDDVAEPK